MFKRIFTKKTKHSAKVLKYLEKIKESFIEDIGFRYPSEDTNGSEYDYIKSVTQSYIKKDVNYTAPEITFTRLQNWHLDNCFYQIIENNDRIKALEYFKMSSYYAFEAIYINHMASKCQWPYRLNYYPYSLVNTYLSQCLIAGYDKEFYYISKLFYIAINSKKLNREDYVNNHETIYLDFDTDRFDSIWFLYHLFSKIYNERIIEKSNDITGSPYRQVIDNWDSDNMGEIEKYVYILSEYHLEKTGLKNEKEQLAYEFNNPLYWLFPYEILTWLKLRELKGIKNPKTFTHPLMNTPIAKIFLNIKEPLSKPKELPFAKELLEKLKEKCPDMEVPEWLV